MLFKPALLRSRQAQAKPHVRLSVPNRRFTFTSQRKVQKVSQEEDNSIGITRNIGIIAHIDAVCLRQAYIPVMLTLKGKNHYNGADALLQWLYSSLRE